MKNLKILALTLLGSVGLNAQDLNEDQVPTNLKNTFYKTYNNATDIEWEREGLNYKVEFEIDRLDHEIWYNEKGKIIKSEKEITKYNLPKKIAAIISDKYSDYKIDSIEVYEIEDSKTYEIELEKGWSTELNVVIDAKGRILSEKVD